MNTLLVTDDRFLAGALRTWMDIPWTGDPRPFVLTVRSCRKLVILVDDRIQRQDCLRIQQRYPENVFLIRIGLSDGTSRWATEHFLYSVDGRADLTVFMTFLSQYMAMLYRKAVPPLMHLRTTRMEKRVMLFLSHGASVREVAQTLSLTEKNILNHCYSVVKKYGFRDLTMFLTFMFPRYRAGHDTLRASAVLLQSQPGECLSHAQ